MTESRGLFVYALEFKSGARIEGIEVEIEESGAADPVLPLETEGG